MSPNPAGRNPVAIAPDLRVKIMSEERTGLRAELIEMQKSIHRVVFAFVTVSLILAGLYWDQRIIPDDKTRGYVLFALTQVDYFLALFLVALNSNIQVHSGYLRALEVQINELCGKPTSLWESRIVGRFLFNSRSAFSWTVGFGSCFLLMIFLYLIKVAFPVVNHFLGGALFVVELVVLGGLLVATWIQMDDVTSFALREFQSGGAVRSEHRRNAR